MLEYNPSCAKSVGTNEFYFLDTSRSADEIKYIRRNVQHVRNDADNAYEVRGLPDKDKDQYNKGFAARKALLGTSAKVNCEIPLNRYSFFEELQDKVLPNVKIDLNIEFDDDKVFRDVMKYVNANNDLQGGTILSISNFKTLFPFIYFDLPK